MIIPLVFATTAPIVQPARQEPVKVLVIMNKILSMGGPLRFDEKGICFIGEESSRSDEVDSYNGVDFKIGPDYWKMIRDNREKADALSHIKVEDGKLYHDNRLIDFDLVRIRWINKAIYWQDWVLAVGLTSKEQADYNNIEPRELVYYNWKTGKGGSIYLINKALPDFKILTK